MRYYTEIVEKDRIRIPPELKNIWKGKSRVSWRDNDNGTYTITPLLKEI